MCQRWWEEEQEALRVKSALALLEAWALRLRRNLEGLLGIEAPRAAACRKPSAAVFPSGTGTTG